jgi:hypothetical protein
MITAWVRSFVFPPLSHAEEELTTHYQHDDTVEGKLTTHSHHDDTVEKEETSTIRQPHMTEI